ncbi:MAG: MFS transporter [Methylocystaceae bacterium]
MVSDHITLELTILSQSEVFIVSSLISLPTQAVFFTAYLLSAFGYEFIFFIMTLHIFDLSHSAINVAWFTALTFLPRLLAPYLGQIADLRQKEKVFVFALGTAGLLILALALVREMAWIYGLWFAASLLFTLTSNVRTALMTIVMPKGSYVQGNSLVLISLNGAKLLAPLIGGLIIALYSTRLLLFGTAAVYLLAMVFALILKLPSVPLPEKSKLPAGHASDGLRYLWEHQSLRFLLILSSCWRLFLGMQVSLFVVYIKDYLKGSDTQYGLFMSAMGIASLLGSLAGPWLLRAGVSRRNLANWGVGINFASLACLGLTHSFVLAVTAVFIGSFTFYAAVVALHSLRDENTEVEVRGRVYGTVTAVLAVATVISMLAGGFLAPILGSARVLLGGAVLTSLAVMAATRMGLDSPVRSYSKAEL